MNRLVKENIKYNEIEFKSSKEGINMTNETKIRAYLEQEHLDAFFIAKQVNTRFTSGWTGDDSYIILTPTDKFFITDPRYTEQAEIELTDYTIVNWRFPHRTVGDTVARIATENQIHTMAFESDCLEFDMYADLKQKAKLDLVPAGGVIDKMRVIKTPEEIQNMRIACDISCRAFRRILNDIKIGVTEKELAAKLSLYMVEEGADTQPYGNILISGARTSLLHGIPSEKAIEYGDLVLMDYGCQYHGYLSDMTRTVVVGKATKQQREVYEYEKRSLEACEQILRPGTRCNELYPKSLEPLKGTGYADKTYAAIGHSIGLFVHELPYFEANYDDVLVPNSVYTIEPGIYLPDWGGIRIEDQVVITENGYENMIDIPHDLIEL
jgi:Xaa-Pro aminopeptidase